MSSSDEMQLARRVCDASQSICELLSSRVHIKVLRSDILNRSQEVCTPNCPATSLNVVDQIAHFARLDAISAQIDEWEGITPNNNTTKYNSRSKRSEETTVQSIDDPEETQTVNANDIKAFNDQRFGSAVDITKICEQDKQTFRPIFRHVPRLQDVVKQIEGLVDVEREKQSEEEPHLTELLERLQQLVLDVTYLEQNKHIYDCPNIEPYDDPVQACLEDVYKQIMNLYCN